MGKIWSIFKRGPIKSKLYLKFSDCKCRVCIQEGKTEARKKQVSKTFETHKWLKV